MKHKIEATAYQLKALASTARNILMLGGIGTGKTFLGALWVIFYAIKYNGKRDSKGRGLRIIIAANTYTQLMTATVETLTVMLDMFGIPYKAVLSGARKRVTFLTTTCYLYSLEKPDNIRGPECDLAWIDEGCFSKEEGYTVVKGRMRAAVVDKVQLLTTSSPNGFNHMYDKYEGKDNLVEGDKDFGIYELVRARTDENFHLREGYYEELERDYVKDSPLCRQELYGEFVALTAGSIYWGFDREKCLEKCELREGYPVYVGLDFNIDNMNAVYVQFIGGKFYVCKEVSLRYTNAGTYDMAGRITSDLKGHDVFVIPDSTGKNRNPASYMTDSHIQMLKDMGLRVLSTRNPAIRSRQTTVNKHFADGVLKLNVDMTETMKELETLNGRDNEGKVVHLSVALGYVCWKLLPVKRERQTASVIGG